MKFVQRMHYCSKCEKNAYYLNKISAQNLEKDFKCPRCGNSVISFWDKMNNRYVLSYIIGTPFFGASAIYGLWTSLVGSVRGVDIFIMIINVLIAAVIVVSGLRYKQKATIPDSSIKTLSELRAFKVQNFWILLFTFTGYLSALAIDVILYFCWIGIEALVT